MGLDRIQGMFRRFEPKSDPIWRLRLAVGMLAALMGVGTVGYTLLEGMSPFNAFYMTLITISTVGFSEVGPLHQVGRVFTTGLIMSGLFLVAFTTASFIEVIVEGGLARRFGRRRLQRQIADLKGHWIICGFGRMGELVAQEIMGAERAPDFVVIDKNSERIRECEDKGILYIQDDATDEEALKAAGIDRAAGLISLVASDAENVFICLTAREMAPDLTIVARSLEERSEPKLRRAGADKVISPYNVGGHRLSQAVLRPAVAQFLEYAAGRHLLELDQAEVKKGSALVGRQLKDSGLRRDLDIIVLAIRRASGEMLFNPRADSVLQEGDTLIAMGEGACLRQLEDRAAHDGQNGAT